MAQKELFNRYHREMLGFCMRMTKDQSVSEDIVQESFVKGFLRIKQLKQPDKFVGWLKRIVVNECIDYLKSTQPFVPFEPEYLNEIEDDQEGLYDISIKDINSAIDLLPKGCRQVVVLYLIEEYQHKEIAKMLNISTSTSKSQYRYGLHLLRETLKAKMS